MFTPENIKKLTNVSIITYKTNTHHYELALFPNKLYEYHHNIETDISKLLHTPQIFTNISKGVLASSKQIKETFNNMSHTEIIHHILKHGTEKKNEKTRAYELYRKELEIASIVSEKLYCNGKNMNIDSVIKLMKEKGLSVCLRKEAKVQARTFIKMLICDNKYLERKIKVRVDMNNENVVEMSGEDFMLFVREAEKNGTNYVVIYEDNVQEEEIC